MLTKPITDSEIADIKVSSLPSRPTAPTSFGGRGYTATEMKEAFDKLPLYIISRFNSLLAEIGADPAEGSVASSIMTGLSEGHTLKDLFSDVKSGEFSKYLSVFDESLISHLSNIRDELDKIQTEIGGTLDHSLYALKDEVYPEISEVKKFAEENCVRQIENVGSDIMVYARSGHNKDEPTRATASAVKSSIVRRNANGTFNVGAPVTASNPATKAYVDSKAVYAHSIKYEMKNTVTSSGEITGSAKISFTVFSASSVPYTAKTLGAVLDGASFPACGYIGYTYGGSLSAVAAITLYKHLAVIQCADLSALSAGGETENLFKNTMIEYSHPGQYLDSDTGEYVYGETITITDTVTMVV